MNGSPYVDEELVLLPAQVEQFFYTEKWGGSRGGQGAGKTTAWAYWLWLERMEKYPASNFAAVAASYQQLAGGIFATLEEILNAKGLRAGRDYHTWRGIGGAPKLRLYNGATLHSWSAEAASRKRGANVQTLIVEEPQTWGPQAETFWESINGRLRTNQRVAQLYPDLQPQGRLSFNPTGVGPGHWLYEMLEKRWPEQGYRCWQMSSRDNALLLRDDPGYVRNLEIGMDPRRHPVEIDGEYATMGGGVYRRYDYNVHHQPPEGMPALCVDETKPILWSLDFNVGLMCSVIAQTHLQQVQSVPQVDTHGMTRFVKQKSIAAWQERIFYIIDEIALPDAGVEDLVPELLSRYPFVKRTGVWVYGDPSGGNRNQIISGNNPIKTNWMRIYADLRTAGVPYTRRVVKGAVHPNDHINMVNMQLNSGPGPEPQSGFGMVIDENRCVELLNDYRMVAYEPGTNKVEKKTKPPSAARRTHAADASGYLLYVERAMAFEKRKFEWQMDR